MTDQPNGNEDLERRLRQADPQALGELFALHRPRLWRMVNFRMDPRLAGRVDSDDVLQEAYIAALARIEHYGKDGFRSPFIWLRIIAQQSLIDAHRRHLGARMRDVGREVPIVAQRYPRATSASLAIQLVGDWTSPSQAAVRGEALGAVEAAIAEMDPINQEILALRHFEELTNTEVAEVLDIEPKAASIRYVRALARLKQALRTVPGLFEAPNDD